MQAFGHGSPSARELAGAKLGPLLEPLARAALIAPAGESKRAVNERASTLRRRVRSAAARDLVICAVLGGALIYALFADTLVGWTFYALGGTAAVLLLTSVAERMHVDREIARVGSQFGASVGGGRSEPPRASTGCRVCGEPAVKRLTTAEDVGQRLWSLGAREILVCPRCGAITGRTRGSAIDASV